MATKVETTELGEEGNTTTSSPPLTNGKQQVVQHMHWCFTWNNYKPEDIETCNRIFSFLAYDYVFQEEVGESGTPHLQGTVSLKKKGRWTEFGLPKDIHWEHVKHVPLSYKYCSEPMKRSGGCWSLKWPIPPKVKTISEQEFYPWQELLVNLLKQEPDDRTIHWVWSEDGRTGKSSFCKWLLLNRDAALSGKGAYSDICNLIYNTNMNDGKIVVFDLPRNNGNKISYSALECIKNGLIVNTKYETGYKVFNPPHVVVFSNMEPEEGAMSADRFKIIEARNNDKIARKNNMYEFD